MKRLWRQAEEDASTRRTNDKNVAFCALALGSQSKRTAFGSQWIEKLLKFEQLRVAWTSAKSCFHSCTVLKTSSWRETNYAYQISDCHGGAILSHAHIHFPTLPLPPLSFTFCHKCVLSKTLHHLFLLPLFPSYFCSFPTFLHVLISELCIPTNILSMQAQFFFPHVLYTTLPVHFHFFIVIIF